MSAKSSQKEKLGNNPESTFISPIKLPSKESSFKNSKQISKSASPCYSSEMTINKLPPSLP